MSLVSLFKSTSPGSYNPVGLVKRGSTGGYVFRKPNTRAVAFIAPHTVGDMVATTLSTQLFSGAPKPRTC
jgi:hypothetical protein